MVPHDTTNKVDISAKSEEDQLLPAILCRSSDLRSLSIEGLVLPLSKKHCNKR
jgi:hypothetical protein